MKSILAAIIVLVGVSSVSAQCPGGDCGTARPHFRPQVNYYGDVYIQPRVRSYPSYNPYVSTYGRSPRSGSLRGYRGVLQNQPRFFVGFGWR